MSECMQFPDTWEEFEQAYGFEDKKEIYTNGSRLMQSFRVKQWLDHIAEPERTAKVVRKGRTYVLPPKTTTPYNKHSVCLWDECSNCGRYGIDKNWKYCPSCGLKLDWSNYE